MTENGDVPRQGRRDDRADLQPAPNASMWGFAIEALHLLYRIGPAAVVVAGFLVFGYFFYQEVNRAKEQADKQLVERLKTSQEQLVATYAKMGQMSDKLIQNVQSLLDLSDRIDKDIEANRGRLKKVEQDVETRVREAEARSAAAQQEADKALAEADTARREVAELNDDMVARQAELERRETELQKQLQALEEQRKTLEVQVSKLREERKKGQEAQAEMATQIARLRPEAMPMSTDADEPSVEQTLEQRLAAFAKDPRATDVEDLRALIGLDVAIVGSLAGVNTGFAAWIQANDPKDVDGGQFYGLVGDSPTYIDAVLALGVGQRRVIGVQAGYGVIVTKLPKADNWYEAWTVAIIAEDNQLYPEYIDRDFGSWTMSEIIESVEPDGNMRIIAGSERRKSIASLPEVQELHPDAYGRWAAESDPFGRPALILGMMRRAKDFRAASLPGMDTLKPELREVMVRLLEAAVADRRELIEADIDPTMDRAQLGALAGLALRDKVRVDSVRESDVSDRGGKTIEKRAVVTLSFADQEVGAGVRLAPLDFRREDEQWKLMAVSVYR